MLPCCTNTWLFYQGRRPLPRPFPRWFTWCQPFRAWPNRAVPEGPLDPLTYQPTNHTYKSKPPCTIYWYLYFFPIENPYEKKFSNQFVWKDNMSLLISKLRPYTFHYIPAAILFTLSLITKSFLHKVKRAQVFVKQLSVVHQVYFIIHSEIKYFYSPYFRSRKWRKL